jgi:zinc transport system ATP-binding protein
MKSVTHAAQGFFRARGVPEVSEVSGAAVEGARVLLALERATLGYPGRPVLRDVSLVLREGEYLGIVGPNGSGKSTLLKTMLGLLPPLAGRVRRSAGSQVAESGQSQSVHFGYVPQRESVDLLFPLTVRQVVAMGRYGRAGLIRRLGRGDWERVDHALERVGIADLARRGLAELSGGQRQRALIARALATEPEILVLDEPTNGMDLASEHALLELIDQLHRASDLTVLMVTHLLNNVANYAERVAILCDGRLEAGERDVMLSEARLSRLYRMPVRVDRRDGLLLIAAERNGGAHSLATCAFDGEEVTP